MQKIGLYVLIIIAMAAIGCGNNNVSSVVLSPGSTTQLHQIDTANYTTIKWMDSVKDFGTVPQGEKVKIVFHFLNSGDKPLFIASVKPGCGCTLADYTKSAVLPGGQGEV